MLCIIGQEYGLFFSIYNGRLRGVHKEEASTVHLASPKRPKRSGGRFGLASWTYKKLPQ